MSYLIDLKYIKVWFSLGLFWVLVITSISLYPRPPDLSSITFGDKIVHCLSYFWLMIWFLQIVKIKAQLVTAFAIIALGVMIEVLQGLSGYRTFDFYDMLANSAGVLIAWKLKNTEMVNLISKFESRLIRAV